MYRCISVYANAFVTTWCHLGIYVQLSIHLLLESLYLCGTTKEKQLVLVSYLFELVYDLMIAPGNNVSVNGGFESRYGYVTE